MLQEFSSTLNTGIQYLPVDSMHTSLQLFSQSHCDNSIRHGHYLGNNPLPQDKLAQMSREDWEKIVLLGPSPPGTEQAQRVRENPLLPPSSAAF